MNVLITRKIPEAAELILKEAGFDVTVFEGDFPIPRKELLRFGKTADGIISLLTDKIDKEQIDQFRNCKVIANYAVGFNNIDVDYAKEKGITVTNTPNILTDATADLAMSLILSCARNLVEADRFVKEGKFEGWKPKLLLGIELRGKTIGIIGAGRIGSETVKRAKAFGMNVIYYSSRENKNLEKDTNAKKVSLDYLMENSEVISVHLPLTDKTHHLLNEEKLNLMKPSAIFVNTARGEIVDEKVLIEMLKKKKIFSAGFDVYENEPEINKELFQLNNVILLPHLGSATFDARNKMAELAAQNVVNVLSGKAAVTPV